MGITRRLWDKDSMSVICQMFKVDVANCRRVSITVPDSTGKDVGGSQTDHQS